MPLSRIPPENRGKAFFEKQKKLPSEKKAELLFLGKILSKIRLCGICTRLDLITTLI